MVQIDHELLVQRYLDHPEDFEALLKHVRRAVRDGIERDRWCEEAWLVHDLFEALYALARDRG